MAYVQTASIAPNYSGYPLWYLKFYEQSTTTPILIYTDDTGATSLAKCQVNLDGFLTTDGTALFIPFVLSDTAYDAYLFPTSAEADSNDTSNAIRVAYDITPIAPVAQADASALGSIGNPYVYATLYDFVNAIPYSEVFTDGDWIQFNGRTLENDGHLSRYKVTSTPPTIRRNFENYIPLDADGDGATLWAVLIEGFKRNFKEQPLEIIAHRSFHYIGVQNTSFNDNAAMKYGAHSLETDVQVTSDGELVRYHDVAVDAKTDGTGTIASLTYAQVRALILDDVAGTILANRIKIGRFDEFVKFAKSVGARIYPEIKQYRSIADIQLIVDVIEAYDYESMTVLQSFNIDDLVEVRRINKRVGVGWLTANINSAQQDADFDKLQKLKYADVLIQEGIITEFPSLVQKIYDAGIGCAAWGLENNTEINNVLSVGVYRQMLDQPQLIASARGLQNVNY